MHRDDGAQEETSSTARRRKSVATRLLVGAGALVLGLCTAVVLTFLLGRPDVSVSSSRHALVQLHVGGLTTELTDLRATSAGRSVGLERRSGGLVPATRLAQGQAVHIRATARPASWLRWLLGPGVSATTTVRIPAASPTSDVAVSLRPGRVPVRFDRPVRVVEYRSRGGSPKIIHLASASALVDLPVPTGHTGGSLLVAGAPSSWELVAPVRTITWFGVPAGRAPVVLAQPVPGSSNASMHEPITLAFNEPVATVLGRARPSVSPTTAGVWSEPGPDKLVFTPSGSGFGYGPGAEVTVRFPRSVNVLGTTDPTAYHFSVRPGSMLRLEQILAQLHYLPLNFIPAPGVSEPTTVAGEMATIERPLAGSFSWRWASTPATLKAQWSPGSPTTMLKGALMAFDATQASFDGYQVDGETVTQLANAATWKALLTDAATNRFDPFPYSYVHVSEHLPETLTLWENGSVVLKSPANTGIPVDPTATGTYPIYVRFAENYMSGVNPNGSHYHDLVQWINYFNGGDAVHGFVRASYGFPQSLGCVELPVSTAAAAFRHLAIGDLVTVVS